MSAIEFLAPTGKTFSVQLYNATTNVAIGSPITGVVEVTVPTRYRASTGSNTGIVYVVATSGNVKRSGYANLDDPSDSGYSGLVDTIESAKLSPVVVRPLQLEQAERALGNNVDLVTGETPLDAFDVLADSSGNIPDLNTLTLEVIIETINKATRIVIADANIARDVEYASPSVPSAATAMWRWPSGVTTNPSEWRWSLRETANDTRLAGGLVTVTYEP